MKTVKTILVGEGTAEPTTGFHLARQYFKDDEVVFYFGVRRSSQGLDQLDRPSTRVVANFPGRGMRGISCPVSNCPLSSYAVHRAIATGRFKPDAALVVATPPDANGARSIGTANGPIATALKNTPLIFVEEYPGLNVVAGAPIIPADSKVLVIPHKPAAFTSLSRPPEQADFLIAEHISSLIPDHATIQLGVGGIIDALSQTLAGKNTTLKVYQVPLALQ